MTKREEWARRIKEQETSGESISGYCRRCGISKGTLEYWRAKLKKEENGKFVAVIPAGHGEVTIELRSGAIIRVPDLRMLSSVVEALDAARA